MDARMTLTKTPVILALLVSAACAHAEPTASSDNARGHVPPPPASLDRALADVMAKNGVVTAGVGLIDDGKLVWTGYYGEQEPGVPASEKTRFNVASITKTVAAETALRLVAEGKLDLDAPLAPYWVDPDIAHDPRREQLTARMVLNHTSGFPNWRFFRADRKLTFENNPGATYGYSGEGFEYLARAIENKLRQPFPRLVETYVFQPIGMTASTLEIRREGLTNLARPVDEQGVFPGYYCRPNGGGCREDGSYSAADDMIVTVPDYARFLISVMSGKGYDSKLASKLTSERNRVQTDKGKDRVVDCKADAAACPHSQGYGLGFEVIDYGKFKVIGHGGSDWSELAIAYFYEPSDDAAIVFLNAPNRRALSAMPELISLLDPHSPYLSHYRAWLAREVENERRKAARK
jgi:CubicO group peptidase (beta-lactamase class C family)